MGLISDNNKDGWAVSTTTNPRTEFEPEDLERLAAYMREQGKRTMTAASIVNLLPATRTFRLNAAKRHAKR
jgi:hypothetical protein